MFSFFVKNVIIIVGDIMEMIDINDERFHVGTMINVHQKQVLKEQKERFDKLKELPFKDSDVILEDGKVMLKEGTIIHGISAFSVEKMDNIRKTGILTGQALGIAEDGETYYCADFHRVSKDVSLEDYNKEFQYVDGRTPFGGKGKATLAFVVDPNKDNEELLKYDCYREGKEADFTRSYVNMYGLPVSDYDKVSSILYGVPSNQIVGAVLGEKLIEQKEIVEFMIKLFTNIYLTSPRGELIYEPHMSLELVDEKRKNSVNKSQLIEMEKTLESTKNQLSRKDEELNRKMKIIFENVPEDVANILVEKIGWQGSLESLERFYSVEKEVNKSK